VDDDQKQEGRRQKQEGLEETAARKNMIKGREERKETVSSTAIEPGTAEGDNLPEISTSLGGRCCRLAKTTTWKRCSQFLGGMRLTHLNKGLDVR
jgi:hypothetical protein